MDNKTYRVVCISNKVKYDYPSGRAEYSLEVGKVYDVIIEFNA